MNTNQTLSDMIATACAIQPMKARKAALKAIRWVLRTENGRFAVLSGLDCTLGEREQAQVFTGLDNEASKLAFWQQALGVKLVISLL